ncbi:MAG: hypothetical protein HC919_08770 [Oscillatoriales cyanobacterium SM2_2_1]|nr:hypothetical protein [Oscillatoriales cyanobacterium SM2_2_1]
MVPMLTPKHLEYLSKGNSYLTPTAKQNLGKIARKRYGSEHISDFGETLLNVLEEVGLTICVDGQVFIRLSGNNLTKQITEPKLPTDHQNFPPKEEADGMESPFRLIYSIEDVKRLLTLLTMMMLSKPQQKLQGALDLFDRDIHEVIEDFLKLNQLYEHYFEDILGFLKIIILNDFDRIVQERRYLEAYIRFIISNPEIQPETLDTEGLKFFLLNHSKVNIDLEREENGEVYRYLVNCLRSARISIQSKRQLMFELFDVESRVRDYRRLLVKNALKYCDKVIECEKRLPLYAQKSLYVCALGYVATMFGAMRFWDVFEDKPMFHNSELQVVPRVQDLWFGKERSQFAGKVYFSGSGRLLYFAKHPPFRCYITTDRAAQFLMSCGYEFISRKAKFMAVMCGTDEIPVNSAVRSKLMSVLC